MKFFYKHKKFIARVLCVTVSLMLLISSIPVGASTISSAGYDKTLCTFSSYVSYGTSHTINNSDRVRGLFSADYGSYSDGEFHFILSSPISINSSNASSKGIGFNLYFPYVLKTAGDNFKVAFKTNLKGFILKLDGASIIGNFQNVGGDYGQIVKLQHFVDYTRISAMHDYAGDFQITGLIVVVSGGAGQVLGNNNYIAISDFYDCTLQTVTATDEATFILNALRSMLQLLGDGFSTAINFLGYDILAPYIEDILDGLGAISNVFSSVFSVFFEDLLMPVLESQLSVLRNLSITIAEKLEPIISNMVNFFAPYFNDLSDLITDNFIFLIKGLEPIFNQFTADVQFSFGSIAENMVKNIRKIIEECFIPDNSSVQVKEFISIKDELTSKIPLFTQFGTFLNTLFNPDDYYVSYTVLESTYLNISSFRGYYRFNKPLPPGDYKIVFVWIQLVSCFVAVFIVVGFGVE